MCRLINDLINRQGRQEGLRREGTTEKSFDHWKSNSASQPADTDEVGHAFQYDVGHLFRSEVGHHSEMKPATRRVATVGLD